MLHISFAMTSESYRDRTKTVTRRFWKPTHAKKFKKGTVFMGITKDFRAGGERMHPSIMTRDPWLQALKYMNMDHFHREGGVRYWINRLCYIEIMGGPDAKPYVIEFEHLPDDYEE